MRNQLYRPDGCCDVNEIRLPRLIWKIFPILFALLAQVDLAEADFLQAILTPTDGSASTVQNFGRSVAIQGDTVIIGAQGDDERASSAGATYIYQDASAAGDWTSVTETKLTASDAGINDRFGSAVGIADRTVVVGASRLITPTPGPGKAYIYRDTSAAGDWTSFTETILTASDEAIEDWFGFTVAISGRTVVVGAYGATAAATDSGAAYIYQDTSVAGDWTSFNEIKLTPSDAAADALFGNAVAIEGNTILVGARRDDDAGFGTGAVYIYQDTSASGDWASFTEIKLTASDAEPDEFGWSVAIADNTVAVGAYYDEGLADASGSVYIYQDTSATGDWTSVTETKLTASDGREDEHFGSSLALTTGKIVIGALHDNDGALFGLGSAYVYEDTSDKGDWTAFREIELPDREAESNNFGESVALSGNTLLIGARGGTVDAAYIFDSQLSAFRGKLARPIELGTTGGNVEDSAAGICCSGTLGSLVEDSGGVQYILSNNHVIAKSNDGTVGDSITQPGLGNQSPVCDPDINDTVANLSDFVTIRFLNKNGRGRTNEVDAAIAQVLPGAVRSDGSIVGIGPVSSSTLAPVVGMQVQKSGQTTGHTFGIIEAVDVTVELEYPIECGSSTVRIARFTNQIRISPGAFSDDGDSSSLIVESGSLDPSNDLPRPVGLLFAGSPTSTLANPIDTVLDLLAIEMVSPLGSIEGTVSKNSDATPIEGATVSADTGQSTLTEVDGSYLLSDVPVGSRLVMATAAGFAVQNLAAQVFESQTSALDFSLEETIQPTQVIVNCLTYDTRRGRFNDKDLLLIVSLVDEFGDPVPDAEVHVDLSLDGTFYASAAGAITGATGEVFYTAKNAPSGQYMATVTDVTSSLDFEGSTPDNQFIKGVDPVPDQDCRGDAPQPSSTTTQQPDRASAAISHAAEAKSRHELELFEISGIVGTGISLSSDGTPVIEVYLDQDRATSRARIPRLVEGIPTRIVITGPFVLF